MGPNEVCSRNLAAVSEVAGGGTDVNVTVACPNAVGFATDVARIVTAIEAGMAGGAVYTPAAVITPALAEPPGVPFALHVTAVFGSPATVARNVVVLPS